MDLQQPNGLGRRKRHSTNLGYVESVPIPKPESLKRRRNFFPVVETEPETVTSRNNETAFAETEVKDNDKSAKIDDNVSLTVLIPGGESNYFYFGAREIYKLCRYKSYQYFMKIKGLI